LNLSHPKKKTAYSFGGLKDKLRPNGGGEICETIGCKLRVTLGETVFKLIQFGGEGLERGMEKTERGKGINNLKKTKKG